MVVMLFRPSPQVPQPMTQSVIMCYDAATANVKNIHEQMKTASVDITWVFVLTIFQALNTILWTTSYSEIRALHPKKEMESHVEIALDTIIRCQERWPGTGAAAQLYSKLAQACLKSYGQQETDIQPASKLWKDGFSFTDFTSEPIKNAIIPVAAEKSLSSSDTLYCTEACDKSPRLDHQYFLQQPELSMHDSYGNLPDAPTSFQTNFMFDISPFQVDRRFTYFPPENMQPSSLSEPSAKRSGPLLIKQETQEFNSIDSSYSIDPPPYSFGPSMHGNQDLDIEMSMGSLSHQQQAELIQDLEMNGLNEIEHLMNHSSDNENYMKSNSTILS